MDKSNKPDWHCERLADAAALEIESKNAAFRIDFRKSGDVSNSPIIHWAHSPRPSPRSYTEQPGTTPTNLNGSKDNFRSSVPFLPTARNTRRIEATPATCQLPDPANDNWSPLEAA
jgi:hypothetical protein